MIYLFNIYIYNFNIVENKLFYKNGSNIYDSGGGKGAVNAVFSTAPLQKEACPDNGHKVHVHPAIHVVHNYLLFRKQKTCFEAFI